MSKVFAEKCAPRADRRGASLWLALALVGLSLAPASAQQTGAPANDVRPPTAAASRARAGQEISESARLVTEFEVNGLKVLVKRREGSQSIVAGLFLRGGSRNVTAETAGVEALMLDVATESSASFPRERMRRELSRTGTSMSYGINYDYSAFTLGSTRQHFDRAWEVFTDAALRPSFAPEDFARIKNRLIVGLSGVEDTPDSYLNVLQSRVAFAGHPYLNDPRGTVQSITRLTVEDVRRHHQQMMQTSRLLLVVVGDIEPDQLRRKVESSFGKLPRGDYRPTPVPPLSFEAQTVEVAARNLETNYVQGVFVAPPLTAADYYPMQVATSLLQNRVFVEVRVRRNLSYAPDAFLRDQGANLGGISVSSRDANLSVRLMLAEINRLQTQPVSPDDLSGVAQHYLTRYYLAQETNAAQAGELAKYELLGGGWRHSAEFIDRLRAVTPEDVRRVAQTYMRNIRFVVLGNPQSIDKSIFTGQAAGE
jgi:predicted Zn-dependent peptidase